MNSRVYAMLGLAFAALAAGAGAWVIVALLLRSAI
jgi:hypothetical protein